MKVLGLFSGIGGFELGLERAGFEIAAMCEIDPFCRKVLAKHWPHVPVYDDVRTLTKERLNADGIVPDLICGGFPCQDISRAGFGAGLDGARSGLWREIVRLVRDLGPRFLVVENVAAILDGAMGAVLGDLADCGLDAEWSTVSACSVGAPHVRQRVFLVAYPNGINGWPRLRDTAPQADKPIQAIDRLESTRIGWRTRLENPSALYGGAHGVPFGMDRNRAHGNAIIWQIAELIGRAILGQQGPASQQRSSKWGA